MTGNVFTDGTLLFAEAIVANSSVYKVYNEKKTSTENISNENAPVRQEDKTIKSFC